MPQINSVFLCLLLVLPVSRGLIDSVSDKQQKEISTAARQCFEQGRYYYSQSRLDMAKEQWKRSLNLLPGYEPARTALQELSEEKWQISAPSVYATTGREFYEEGMRNFRAGRYPEAITEFEKALLLLPEHPQVIKFRERSEKAAGEKTSEEGKTATVSPEKSDKKCSAVKTYRKPASDPGAKENDKKIADELYRKGLKRYREGKIDEAVSLWQKVLRIEPGHEKARKNLEKVKSISN